MNLKKLHRNVLKLWYFRAIIYSLVIIGTFTAVMTILNLLKIDDKVFLALFLVAGIPLFILLLFVLILPYFRYKMYTYGYDDKTIIVKYGVIFKHRIVIPVCQIQDLHRVEGPIMSLFKLSGVTISTAGSNFDISTLTTAEADKIIDELEDNLEVRIEELSNEKI